VHGRELKQMNTDSTGCGGGRPAGRRREPGGFTDALTLAPSTPARMFAGIVVLLGGEPNARTRPCRRTFAADSSTTLIARRPD
jgi:hypothetical protein